MSQPLRTTIFACMAAVLLAAPALAASGYKVGKIAVAGDPAPGTSRNFSAFDVSREGAGSLGFTALLSGDPPQWGAFRASNGSVAPVALDGEVAPASGGGTYRAFLSFPSVDASGAVSFGALLVGGAAARGLYVDQAGVDSALVVVGDAAPGATTFTPTSADLQLHGRNVSGEFAFRSTLANGDVGLFVGSASGFDPVVLVGDLAPGGGAFATLGNPSIGAGGHVAFTSSLTGGPAANGLFRHHASVTTTLALEGDVAPATGGGTYDGEFLYPMVNGSGDVAMVSLIAGGSVAAGYFVAESGGVRAAALEGQVLPETGGGTLIGLGSLPTLNDAGDVAFSAQVGSGSVGGGVFVAERATGQLRAVALLGEEAPGAGGATYSQFWYVGLDGDGNVAFTADLSDGGSGLFLGESTVPVPSLGPGAPLLLLSLAGVILVSARRVGARSV